MKKYLKLLKETNLFEGIDESAIEALLGCLNAKQSHFSEGEYLIRQGERVDRIFVLAEGRLHVQSEDFWGNRNIFTAISTGEVFGQAYLSGEAIMNDVVAVEPSIVISFDADRVLTTCSSACRFHTQVIRNLFFALSKNNVRLVTKLSHISKRTTRAKLMDYLSLMAKKAGSPSFTIPFDRQQLADYLSVERSSLSAELGKMQKEGLLQTNRSRFTLM